MNRKQTNRKQSRNKQTNYKPSSHGQPTYQQLEWNDPFLPSHRSWLTKERHGPVRYWNPD